MDPNIDDKREQDSLAPLQLDRLTIEEEVATMNRGKGARLLTVAMLVSAFTVGGAWWMKAMDLRNAEDRVGVAVTSLRERHLDAYLRCALPEAPASVFSNGERLHTAIEALAERYQKAYARTLESCEPRLTGLTPALEAAPVAGDLEPTVDRLRAAARSVQNSAEDLRGYLSDPRRGYDYVEVTAFIDRLARAAVAYRSQDRALREQLMR